MDEYDTPQGTVTESAGSTMSPADSIAEILDDPDLDWDTGEDEDQAEADATEDEGDMPDVEDQDQTEEDSVDDAPEEDADGPEELKGGKIAPVSAKVKLPDGSLTTVEELLKGYHRQSDYTRKTQELAENRKVFEAEQKRVSETTQQLQAQHARMSKMMEAWKPKRPDNVQDDPVAYIQYQQQMETWNQWNDHLQKEHEELSTRQKQEQEKFARDYLQQEYSALVQKMPSLSDPAKHNAFKSEAKKVMAEYGFSPEEIDAVDNHRFYLVMRDLIRAKRLASKAQETKAVIQSKPKMISGGKRGDPNAAKRAHATERLSRLRESGSVRDGIASLMDLDL